MTEQQVTLIDHMGSDLTVVNAARVSMDKESDWEVIGYDEEVDVENRTVYSTAITQLSQADTKLISYLATHNHWTPFGHPQTTFRIKAPIFVARQLGKHQVGMVWNEVSRRYVDSEPEFYEPDVWRKRAENVKQGSSPDTLDIDTDIINGAESCNYTDYTLVLKKLYEELLNEGVCPEQARMVLPQSMMTEWYWTGSLAAWARVCKLRLDSHSQRETQEIAQLITAEMSKLYPVSWEELSNV